MKKVLQLCGIVVGVILVLSITVKTQTIFDHIYGVISPATMAAQDAVEKLLSKSMESTSIYTKKLFDNSVPKVKDSIQSKASSLKKSDAPSENVTEEDQRQLDQLIRTER